MSDTVPMRRGGGRPTAQQTAALDAAIRETALRTFLEHGYEGTSMDAIAAAAGTTKASLYARYPSKDSLFTAVLQWAATRDDWPIRDELPTDLGDLETALTELALGAQRRALHPDLVQLSRIAIAHREQYPGIADDASSWRRREVLIDLLRRHAAAGQITVDDPDIWAEHFLAMVAGMPARLAAFGVVRDEAEQRRRTLSAVDIFMRALRTPSSETPA